MRIFNVIFSLGAFAIALVPGMPFAAEELPRGAWTQERCEETAISAGNPSGNHAQMGCYGLVGKRMDIFEACYAHAIDFTRSCSYNGTPPLAIAVRNRDVATIDRLALKGADVKAIFNTGWGGNGNVMVVAVAACREQEAMSTDCNAMLRHLIELGVDVNGGPAVNTPLMVAASTGRNLELVKMLLDAGAEINRKDQYGHTAWDHARMPSGYRKIADYLQSRGATGDPHLRTKQLLFEALWPAGQH